MIDSVAPASDSRDVRTKNPTRPAVRRLIRPDKGMTTLSIVAMVFIQSLLSMASSQKRDVHA